VIRLEAMVLRRETLRKINIIFGGTLSIMLLSHWIQYKEHFYFHYMYLSFLLPGIAVALYLFGHFIKHDMLYQKVLYGYMWSTTLFSINIAYWLEHSQLLELHIILLIITVYSIFNRKILNKFFLLCGIFIYPVLIFSDIELSKRLIIITSVTVILVIGRIKSDHDFMLFSEYKRTLESKNQILDNANEAFALHKMIFDSQGNPQNYEFIEVNEAFEKAVGLPGSSIRGKTVLELFPHTERKWIELYGSVVKDGTKRTTVDYSHELGKYFSVSAYPVGESGFAVLFVDATDKILQERRLKFALMRSEKVDKLKTQFLRDINHRLRTPLNGMMGMIQLIDLDNMSSENRELFDAMILELRHSRNIINQIAKYVDIQEMDYEFTRCSISEIIEKQIQQITLPNSQISLDISDELIQDTVYIECKIVTGVFNEVLANAIKNTKNNRVDIKIWDDQSNADGSKFLVIRVKDYGQGIKEDQIDYVFNEFYHHDFINIYKDSDKLSLPMCKQMLINSGGNMFVKSKYGNGATFTIEIPYFTQMSQEC
jgi:signal transduction histidine kinase